LAFPRSPQALFRELQQRGEALARRFVAGSPPERLERTVGSSRGLRVVFSTMASRFDPRAADGFAGSIRYDLKYRDGSVRPWTVTVADGHASAAAGKIGDHPDLVLKVSLVDFLRIGVGELNPLAAVLSGRLGLEGDFGLAMRLASMFGVSPPR
jgi:putative sterol carrier protein